jgi:hypothetical protein
MQRRARGSVTFRDLARTWAPGSNYVSGLESIADSFRENFCDRPDPHPEWVAEARGTGAAPAVAAATSNASESESDRVSGAELARRAIDDGKAAEDEQRSGLGVGASPSAGTPPSYSILNSPASEPASSETPGATDQRTSVTMASAAGSIATKSPRATPQTKPPHGTKTAKSCRVWTASYGGQKALIIRVNSDKGTDFTVLDVNEGAEKREADAYIAAYAKGGSVEAEFASQSQALEKAFELCPEG